MRKLGSLFWAFLWISTVTLGGGMAMLPLMDRAFVEERKWLSEEEMVDILAIVQSLPGLVAVNIAVLVGYRVKGLAGALAAAVAACLTPFAAIVLVARTLVALSDSTTLAHVFLGVRAGVAALILLAAVKLAKSSLKGVWGWGLAAVCFVATAFLGVDVTWAVVLGFAVGTVRAVAAVVKGTSA